MHSSYDLFFFFKQKTAYELRISDWSSDVCSSDLHGRRYVTGWYDPFMWGGGFGGGWDNEVTSYTVYTSDLNLSIDRAGTGERLFDGRAQAQSRDNDLTAIVPNLVQAMFTGFPGNSGERVRITVAPPEKG